MKTMQHCSKTPHDSLNNETLMLPSSDGNVHIQRYLQVY